MLTLLKESVAFVGQNAAGVLLWAFVVGSICMVLAWIVDAVSTRWQREDEKADRVRLDRIMRANMESKPRAAGYPSRHVS